MKVIVGLGNIGAKYENTFHNIGFLAVDKLINKYAIAPTQQKSKYLLTKCKINNTDVLIIKPTTFMNLSGDAVLAVKSFFKVSNDDILIIYDDIDLKKGDIRYRMSGSAGTHNGMRDIVRKIGELPRIRIGIGKDERIPLADYVLSKIKKDDIEIMNNSIDAALLKTVEIVSEN